MTVRPHCVVTEETSKDWNVFFSLRNCCLSQHANHSNRVSSANFFFFLLQFSAQTCASVTDIVVSPFSVISCPVKSSTPFSVAPAFFVRLSICLRDEDATDRASAPRCARATRRWALLWLCQWNNLRPGGAIHCDAPLMAKKMKLPALSSLSLIRPLTLSLRHPGREILPRRLLLFPSSEIYLDRKRLTEIV